MYETIKTETLRFNQYTDSPGHHEVGIQPEPKGRGWSKDLKCFSLIFIKCLSPHVSVGKSRSSDCVTSKSEGTVEQETDRQICAVSAVMWIIHMERIQLRWFGYLTRWGVSKISKQEKILGQVQDAHKRTCLWERLCPPQELEEVAERHREVWPTQTAAPLLCVEHPEDGWMYYTENVNVIFNEIIFY